MCYTDGATGEDVIVVTMSVRWDLSQGLDDGVSMACYNIIELPEREEGK